MAVIRQRFQNTVGVMQRRRHIAFRLAASVTEHNALITCTFVLIRTCINAHGNITGLRMQTDGNLDFLPMEEFLIITDAAHGFAGNALDIFGCYTVRAARFTGNGQKVSRGKTFRGNTCLGLRSQIQINDFIGYTVTDFIGMTF